MPRKAPERGRLPFDVSRETWDDLQTYAALLEKWQVSINLVAPKTLNDLWSRHLKDSLQLLPLLPPDTRTLVDLGTGAGLPGLVLAIALKHHRPKTHVILVESDTRKSAFLREAIRVSGVNAEVQTARIETLKPQDADVLTARALAPLPLLLGYVHRHLAQEGTALLLKGGHVEEELAAAKADWHFKHILHPSLTSDDGAILQIRELSDASAEPA